MATLNMQIETIFDEPDFVVFRSSMGSESSAVAMLVRVDKLHDAVLTMLDAVPYEGVERAHFMVSRSNKEVQRK
jgi:hypothetical protein